MTPETVASSKDKEDGQEMGRPLTRQPCHSAEPKPQEGLGRSGECQAQGEFGKPHPRWTGPSKYGVDRYPATVEEWDPRNDPTGEHHVRAMRRLTVAGDHADPRVDDQMSLVHRGDVLTVLHRLIWREAQVESLREQRDSGRHRNGENSRSEVEGVACQSGGATSPASPDPLQDGDINAG